jgi:hypothetical protein
MANDGTGGGTTTPAIGPFAPVPLPAGVTPEMAAALGVGPLATTTTVAPKKQKVKTPAPTSTVPATTTTTPSGGRGYTPKPPVKGRGSGAQPVTTTTVPAKVAYPSSGGRGYTPSSLTDTAKGFNKVYNPGLVEGTNAADETLDNPFDTTTSAAATAATKAAQNAQNYAQGAAGAKYLLRASQQAQSDYNALGDTAYKNMLAGFNPSYDAQIAKLRETLAANQKTGEQQITDAQAALMKQLQPDTTYQNAPVIQLTPEQQALGNALQTYGASDQLAKNASASQQQINQQIADMFRNTNAQLNEAQKNYYTGMQNAAAQNAAEAKTNLATNTNTALQQLLGQIEGNRSTAISNAEQARQQFQTAGLTAGQQGKSDYATAIAKLIASYGAPKKTAKKKGK